MNLRLQAEQDLGDILENPNEFGWDIVVISPAGVELELTGFSNDISELIDPNTGQSVSGRSVSVALRMSNFSVLPKGIAETESKPWIVKFNDIKGTEHVFKVIQSNPDRGLGIITLILEKCNVS